MNIRKIAYAMLSLSLVLIISGCFSSFLTGLKQDQEVVYHRMEDVTASYEAFSTNVSFFGDYREDFHESILENLYYETMLNTDSLVKTELTKYEDMVDDIMDEVKKLDSLCKDVYYPQGEVNNMCMNYQVMFEQVMNYFILDVEDYNESVTKYNDYQKSIGSNSYVEKYSTTKDYIDYNGDKIFEGKEE